MIQRKNVDLVNKLVNHLIINGNKNKSEKIIWKNIKDLQTMSKKSSKKLVQFALMSTTPVFKVNTMIQKKRKKKKQKPKVIPAFIVNTASRISFAIKFIVVTAKKKKNQKLSEEILLALNNKSNAIEKKKEIQKQVFLNRHLFKYYRWH